MSFSVVVFIFGLFLAIQNVSYCSDDINYWKKLGLEDIKKSREIKIINKPAKNVIIFIGDGMGPTTVTASRIYGKTEKGNFAFEKFTNLGLLKTYSADKLVPDSCSTATALFNGVKANQKTAGVDQTVRYNDCAASLKPSAQHDSIIDWGQAAGKSTGFVTTTRVTHATPSALYAHTPNRKWECENTMPKGSPCKDIAKQLIEDLPGKNIQVIMGGGRQCLQSNVTSTDADPIDTWSCLSTDGRDLIREWEKDKIIRKLSHAFIENNEQLSKLDAEKTDFLLGIFAKGHLKLDYARDKGPKGMPSLANMTEKAIEVLRKNKNGYILMVEGGMIDQSHHRGHARQALDETVAFNLAIEKALEMTNEQETLIIVTADHSHSLVFAGYSDRNNSILNVAQSSPMDKIPYTSLLYGTGGPNNFQYHIDNNTVLRNDPSKNNTQDFEYSQQSAVLNDEVTHSGTDVAIYANGPMAHLFNSVHEQTYVAYVISYAANIGPLKTLHSSENSVLCHFSASNLIILCLAVIIFQLN
ncbi:unnamed protein product [Brassicogethes aeneus]|uniref:alkaline phosphatase n=1 Tax=Brassicogethes aeneus TaxID=1431903 RepID=A0A9P0BIY6_BRAAE|nr:unnamed protein product [Brassicogethes aeneus]